MPNSILKCLYAGAVLFLISTAGCHLQNMPASVEQDDVPRIEKMVVIGFRPAMSEGEESGIIRNPLSGAVFMAEPVSKDVAGHMTSYLFNRLWKDKRFHLVSPAQAKGVFSSLISSDLVSNDIEISSKIGQIFSADAVLIGYVYRWRERQGKDYAVIRPASVAFDLYLIRPQDGVILWKGRFDKTQQTLTANLLDADIYIRGGGKWLQAKRLAELGLDGLLNELIKF